MESWKRNKFDKRLQRQRAEKRIYEPIKSTTIIAI